MKGGSNAVKRVVLWVGVTVAALGMIAFFVPVIIIDSTVGQWLRTQAAASSCNAPIGANTNGVTVDTLNDEQTKNAQIIIEVGAKRGIPQRGLQVAIATAMQESTLKNINYGDRDSLGLFQQRPSQGWGSPAQVRDPVYASNKFYDGLVKVPGWEQLPITVAAQKVQRSAFPDAYAKWENLAVTAVTKLLPNVELPRSDALSDLLPNFGKKEGTQAEPDGLKGLVPGFGTNQGTSDCALGDVSTGNFEAGSWVLPAKGTLTSPYGQRWGKLHAGVDIADKSGPPIFAASDGVVEQALQKEESGNGLGGYGLGIIIRHGVDGQEYKTLYGHQSKVLVQPGQAVKAGQQIGVMGTTGNSTGIHLHFEVHNPQGQKINPEPFMLARGVDLKKGTQAAVPAPGGGAPGGGAPGAVAASFSGPDGGCTQDDPTTTGCLTPATLHALQEANKALGGYTNGRLVKSTSCWDKHAQNPKSDHPKGLSCDFFPGTPGKFAAGAEVQNGWQVANWFRQNAVPLNVNYIIWQGRIWNAGQADSPDGWGKPYNGGGVYNPKDATGGHFDHIHLSIKPGSGAKA